MSNEQVVTWADIQPAAREMFDVWRGGGDLMWAWECWRHLEQAGLTGETDALEKNKTYLRLVTLADVYQQFCWLAWEERVDRSLTELVDFVSLDRVALGLLAAQVGDEALNQCNEEGELLEVALQVATRPRRLEIFACLCDAYGNSVKLYERMSVSDQAPDEDDDEQPMLNQLSARAFEFVTGGFR